MTMIPEAEVDLSTKRLRMFHVTYLNRKRLDYQLIPLIKEAEEGSDNGKIALLYRTTVRAAIVLFKHFTSIDLRESPSSLLLILIKVLDDRTFEAIWNDYAPLVKWVNRDRTEGTKDSAIDIEYKIGTEVLTSSSTEHTTTNGRNERKRKDDFQQNIVDGSSRQEADSDIGLKT